MSLPVHSRSSAGPMVISRAVRIPSGAPCQVGIRILGDSPFCMPWHTHRGVHELVLGLRGTFRHQVNGNTFWQGPGQLLWIRSDAFHELEGSNCAWANIALHPKWIGALGTLFGHDLTQIQTRPALVPERCWEGFDGGRAADFPVQHHSSPEQVRHWLLHLLEATLTRNTAPPTVQPWWLRNALRQIKREPLEQLSIERLCALCQRSREHVARAFRKHLDCTPSSYLNRLRLRHAAHLLETTVLSITEIAFASGFESLNHFFTQFRETFGCSPKQYRAAIPAGF